jgi:hypothetical protein
MQIIFRFDNNYGISVVCHSFSYGRENGLFELAIIRFNSEDNKDWDIDYSTPITKDVLGDQSKEDVFSVIEQVISINK